MLKKVLDLLFRITSFTALFFFGLNSNRPSTSIRKRNSKIAALPFYPENWPGGVERIANWKKYFEKENIAFDVFWASTDIEYDFYLNSTRLQVLKTTNHKYTK